MYTSYMHQGKLLTEWQKLLCFEYSLGELFRMAKDGADLQHLVLQNADVISEP